MKINQLNKKLTLLLIIAIFLTLSTTVSLATDQYKPYLHNPVVPSEKNLDLRGLYSTSLFDGAARYTYDIEVPKGTNDLQPEIELTYGSHNKNQQPSIIGNGWSVNLNYIQRKTEYTRSDTSDDTFDLFLGGQKYDLIYVVNENRYHTDPEIYIYIEKISGGNNNNNEYWNVKTKDGTTYRFGYESESELVSNLESYVSKWSLDLVTDTHGNSIYYNLEENPYPNDEGAVYLDSITYNNDQSREINFVYENSDREDLRTVYSDGNKITISRRLDEIEINVNNQLVRKYEIDYETLSPQSQTFIDNIEMFGSDGVSSLPETTFDYYDINKGWTEDSNWEPPGTYTCFIDSNDDEGLRFVDFTGDGLVDILVSKGDDECSDGDRTALVNTGSGWSSDDSWEPPDALGEDYCFVDDDGRDQGYRFGDLNGDGRTDILVGTEDDDGCDGNDRTAFLSTSNGWSTEENMEPPMCFIDEDGEDQGVRLADVNGDGLVDIIGGKEVSGVCDSSYKFAYINTGSGWVSDSTWLPPSCFVNSGGDDEGLRIVDVNGDGLVDILKAQDSIYATCEDSYKTAYINNGAGWTQNDNWEPPICFSDYSGEDEGTRLADVNGDGLVDILVGARDGLTCDDSERTAYINNGYGWTQDDTWQPNTCFVDYDDGDNEGVKLADVNGDGLVDILEAEENGICDSYDKTTWINNAAKTNLLEEVTTEYGGIIEIDYMQSTLLDNTGDDSESDLSFNLWVVDEKTKDNGITGTHQVFATTTYDYSGGFYDYEKKEFKGFNYAEEEKPNGNIVKHWYHQEDGLEGREYTTEVYDDSSNRYGRTDYGWVSTEQDDYYAVELDDKLVYEYEGDPSNPKITQEEYSYDSYGNINEIEYSGDTSQSGDEKTENYEYIYNTNDWIVNSVFHYYLEDENNNVVEESFYSYDYQSYGDLPIIGDITQIEYWLDTGTNPVTTMTYDSYGNLISKTDSNSHTTQYVYGNVDTTYTYPDEMINAKQQTTTYSHDLGTGNLLSETDSNGYVTEYEYDVFGRKIKEIKPYDSSNYPTIEYEYSLDGTAPESMKTTKREESGTSNTYDSYVFYDGFGTVIQTKTEAENSQQIVNNFYYDEMDRIEESSNPYFVYLLFSYSTPDTSISSTEYVYDPLDRMIQVINPDGTDKEIEFDHWETTVTDENNNEINYLTDAFDLITEVTEENDGDVYTTEYEYDAKGNLLQIEDDEGNTISYEYDSMGRSISLSDPDLGEWSYEYDGEGNLVEQEDANGNIISKEYDELNRVIEKTDGTNEITYVYDNIIIGTLNSITTPGYSTNYDYDERLRLISEEVEIDGETFTKEYEYDAMDRTTNNEVNNQKELEYDFNNQNKVESLFESNYIVDNIEYNENNKPEEIEYDNSLTTEKYYDDEMFRITDIETGSIQDLSYSYDSIGNIDIINNNVNAWELDLEYDDINRLIDVEKDAQDPSDDYSVLYEYDSIGNILDIDYVGATQEEYDFDYVSGPVHAPTTLETTNILENCTGDNYVIWGLTCHLANFCPILSATVDTVREGELAEINTVVTDPDNEQVTLTYSSPFDANGEWQTQMGDVGTYTVTVIAEDEYGCVVEDEIQVEVIPNHCPGISTIGLTVTEGDLAVLSVGDLDNDPFYVFYSSPFNNDGEWQTHVGDTGTYTVAVTAEDDHGCMREWEVLVEVLPNHCPVITIDDQYQVFTETELAFADVDFYDEDNDTLTITYSSPLDNNGTWQTSSGDADIYVVNVTANDNECVTTDSFYLIIWEAADLAIDSLTLGNPNDACLGDVTLEILASNYGGDDAQDVEWQVLDENNNVLSNGEISSIDSGHQLAIYTNLFIDHEQEITVQIDYNDEIIEDNENNNEETLLIECGVPTEDIELYSAIIGNPGDACQADLTLEMRIFNNGEEDQEFVSWRVLDEDNNYLSLWTIPLLESGHEVAVYTDFFIDHSQEITVQVDYLEEIVETNENNNEEILLIECEEQIQDLELESVLLLHQEDECGAEGAVEINIFNQGDFDVEDVTWRILNQNGQVSDDGIINLIDAGYHYIFYQDFLLGDGEFSVEIDYDNEIIEDNENNNEITVSMECEEQIQDLELESVSLLHQEDECGALGSIEINIFNQGDFDVEDVTWNILNQNGVVEDEGVIDLIEAGYHYIFYQDFLLGEREFSVEIDYDNEIIEDDETNNEITMSMECEEQIQDLELESVLLLHQEDECGAEGAVEINIFNQGDFDVEDVTWAILDMNGYVSDEEIIDSIEAGNHYIFYRDFLLGEGQFRVRVDYYDEIDEEDENNNEIIVSMECEEQEALEILNDKDLFNEKENNLIEKDIEILENLPLQDSTNIRNIDISNYDTLGKNDNLNIKEIETLNVVNNKILSSKVEYMKRKNIKPDLLIDNSLSSNVNIKKSIKQLEVVEVTK
jgi:YD repeat-containing protein